MSVSSIWISSDAQDNILYPPLLATKQALRSGLPAASSPPLKSTFDETNFTINDANQQALR